MSGPSIVVTPIGRGAFRVEHDGVSTVVYVAGAGADRWVFWNGAVFRGEPDSNEPPAHQRRSREPRADTLTAPMPARVVRVLVQPGAPVKKGDTLVLLEAMKMELPVRALADGTVRAVHCHDGELVSADAPLVELI